MHVIALFASLMPSHSRSRTDRAETRGGSACRSPRDQRVNINLTFAPATLQVFPPHHTPCAHSVSSEQRQGQDLLQPSIQIDSELLRRASTRYINLSAVSLTYARSLPFQVDVRGPEGTCIIFSRHENLVKMSFSSFNDQTMFPDLAGFRENPRLSIYHRIYNVGQVYTCHLSCII